MTTLYERDAGRAFDVQQRQSEVDQLKGQLEGAQWNLDKTVVKAPADGYVTNLALRKGARVANLPLSPVMAFIDTSSTIIGVEINQSRRALCRAGSGSRDHLQVRARSHLRGQGRKRPAGGRNRTDADVRYGMFCPSGIEAVPFVVRVKLDDDEVVRRLPAGSTGTAAIYTDHVKPTHIIRRVLLRQIAITNYVNPF